MKKEKREEIEKREMSLTSTVAYVARRAAQREKVRILYRRALKDTLNWAVHRHLFYDDVFPFLPFSFFHFTQFHSIHNIFSHSFHFQASNLRDRFEQNKHVVRCFPNFRSSSSHLAITLSLTLI